MKAVLLIFFFMLKSKLYVYIFIVCHTFVLAVRETVP